jgi:anti-sigma regulatory factor (Ser/Thr protein kinase)
VLPGSAFEIVILDRGDQPDVRVVEERLEVWPPEGLARLALGRLGLADRRQVDRVEVADEEGVGRAQPDLRLSPGFIIRLGA